MSGMGLLTEWISEDVEAEEGKFEVRTGKSEGRKITSASLYTPLKQHKGVFFFGLPFQDGMILPPDSGCKPLILWLRFKDFFIRALQQFNTASRKGKKERRVAAAIRRKRKEINKSLWMASPGLYGIDSWSPLYLSISVQKAASALQDCLLILGNVAASTPLNQRLCKVILYLGALYCVLWIFQKSFK